MKKLFTDILGLRMLCFFLGIALLVSLLLMSTFMLENSKLQLQVGLDKSTVKQLEAENKQLNKRINVTYGREASESTVAVIKKFEDSFPVKIDYKAAECSYGFNTSRFFSVSVVKDYFNTYYKDTPYEHIFDDYTENSFVSARELYNIIYRHSVFPSDAGATLYAFSYYYLDYILVKEIY